MKRKKRTKFPLWSSESSVMEIFFHSRAGLMAVTLLALVAIASAQNLTGTVKNATTGKPAAGDEVILLKLGQGMEEAGRTKADGKGQFSFKLDDAQSPHLVRAIHQDVTYHRMAPPGTTSVEVEVFDVGKKIEGIEVVADIMRIQAAQGQALITREFGVQNTSKPPRTQMSERNLEFYVPEGAHIIDESATATTENGNPLKSAPVPEGEKNKYSFIFPLRPGLTRFEVTYQLAYSGSANLDPKSIYPLEHFVVMLPKAMQFTAAEAKAGFKLINYPSEPDAAVQVASNTSAGQNLAFKVSGEGTLAGQESGQEANGSSAAGPEQSSPPSARSNSGPGGGLGPPIDAPDPLQKYRWWILGGFSAVLAISGVIVAMRQQSEATAALNGGKRARLSKPFYLGSLTAAYVLTLIIAIWAIVRLLGIRTSSGGFSQVDLAHLGSELIVPGALLILLTLAGLAVLCFFVYNMWSAIQDGRGRTTPGKAVVFLFIPGFNLYWLFQVWWGFAKDYNGFIGRHLPQARRLSEGLFLAFCILTLAALIPYVGVLAGIAQVVVLFLVVSSVCDAVNALPHESGGLLSSGAISEGDIGPYSRHETTPQPAARSYSSMLLEGLKEELFQLEVERQQGQISQAEYDQAKAALDQTLERALKREAQKA